MNRVILSIRRRVELMELDGTIAATIHAKIVSARGAQDLKDPYGNMIARIKKKITSVFRPKFFLEDVDRWRDIFLGGLMDFKDTYALRILDNETDRRILLGFVLSIDNVLHDM